MDVDGDDISDYEHHFDEELSMVTDMGNSESETQEQSTTHQRKPR